MLPLVALHEARKKGFVTEFVGGAGSESYRFSSAAAVSTVAIAISCSLTI